jgi:hypothetical protein
MSDLRRQASRVPLRSTNTAPHGQVAAATLPRPSALRSPRGMLRPQKMSAKLAILWDRSETTRVARSRPRQGLQPRPPVRVAPRVRSPSLAPIKYGRLLYQ